MGMFGKKPVSRIRTKEVGLSTSGGASWNYEQMLSDKSEWPYGIVDEMDAYKKVGLVRTCINVRSYYVRRNGFNAVVSPENPSLQKFIDDMNWKVNLGRIVEISLIKRQIFGRCGWEIVWETTTYENGEKIISIDSLLPLRSKGIIPDVDNETNEVESYTYPESKEGELKPQQVLYFTLDDMERDHLGLSGIISIKDSVNTKVNLNRDLLESSKRLWAPIGMFKMNTEQFLDPNVKIQKMKEFAASLQPGRSIVYNTAIEDSKIVDLRPDIQGLIRSLEKVDEDIMGFWMVPKAILAREKTITKATLADAMEALYSGPVKADQDYMKEELERQWYPKLVAIWRESHPNDNTEYHVTHEWKEITFVDPALVKAFAYAVRNGVMTRPEYFANLHLKMVDGDKIQQPAKPTPETSEMEKNY